MCQSPWIVLGTRDPEKRKVRVEDSSVMDEFLELDVLEIPHFSGLDYGAPFYSLLTIVFLNFNLFIAIFILLTVVPFALIMKMHKVYVLYLQTIKDILFYFSF